MHYIYQLRIMPPASSIKDIKLRIMIDMMPVSIRTPEMYTYMSADSCLSLFLIDLSVPRNVDPACGLVDDVYVYDMDAMEKMTEETRRLRAGEIAACEQMIRAWVQENADSLLKKRVFCGACV